MTLWKNRFFVVSDNDDETIYELHAGESTAILRPYVRFAPPPLTGVKKLDLEGISCDEEGNFYLVCERVFRVLRVSADGRQAAWVTPSLLEEGKRAGLFQVMNGGLEGIAYVSPNHLLLCAEREARGILEIRTDRRGSVLTQAWNCDAEQAPSRFGRPPDFSDLCYDRRRLFALVRADEGVAEIQQRGCYFQTRRFWSFSRTTRDPAYSYRDATYGKAEGLAMNKERIFVILDNNGDARTNDENDTRPLFFIFRRPR